jgi:prepilin-type N-terminal cleavage/methylation domain-containing protein
MQIFLWTPKRSDHARPIQHTVLPSGLKPEARARAMTLVELIMVVTVVGILSAVAVMRVGPERLGRPGVRAFARQLGVDLRYARSLAVTEGTNHYVGFDSSGYSVYRRETPTDVAVDNYRKIPSGISGSMSAWNFEFEPTGAALAAYQCTLSVPGLSYRIRVRIVTGTITVRKL